MKTIYIPHLKKQLTVPTEMSKFAYLLNYRGLHTTHVKKVGQLIEIEFNQPLTWIQYMDGLYKSKDAPSQDLYDFIENNVMIEVRPLTKRRTNLQVQKSIPQRRASSYCFKWMKTVILFPTVHVTDFYNKYYASTKNV